MQLVKKIKKQKPLKGKIVFIFKIFIPFKFLSNFIYTLRIHLSGESPTEHLVQSSQCPFISQWTLNKQTTLDFIKGIFIAIIKLYIRKTALKLVFISLCELKFIAITLTYRVITSNKSINHFLFSSLIGKSLFYKRNVARCLLNGF